MNDCYNPDKLCYKEYELAVNTYITIPGDTGPTGEQGLTGIPGYLSNTGPQGEQGPRGDTGNTGPEGLPGDMANTGPQGNIGPQGITGPQGNIGPRGERGLPGSFSNTGPIGPTGLPGPTGPATGVSSGTLQLSFEVISGTATNISGRLTYHSINNGGGIYITGRFTWIGGIPGTIRASLTELPFILHSDTNKRGLAINSTILAFQNIVNDYGYTVCIIDNYIDIVFSNIQRPNDFSSCVFTMYQ